MSPPEVERDVILVNYGVSIIGTPDSGGSSTLTSGSTPTITYPGDGATVSSPVTFTGTAASGATVELWDTAAMTITEIGQQTASGLATGEGLPDGGTTLVLSTVPANTWVYVAVDMYCSSGSASPAITSITVGGNAMSLCGTAQAWSSAAGLLHLYRYYSAAGMTTPEVVTVGTVTTGNFKHVARAWAISDLASSQAGAGYNSTSGTGANPSTSVTTTANGSVIFAVGALWTTNSAGTNTELVGTAYNSGSIDYVAYKNTQTTTSGSPYSVNITEAGGDFWALVATELKPA
jgi:hypothetical protein